MKIKSVKNNKVKLVLTFKEFKMLEFLLQYLHILNFKHINHYLYDNDEFKSEDEYSDFVKKFNTKWHTEVAKYKLFPF